MFIIILNVNDLSPEKYVHRHIYFAGPKIKLNI